MLVQSFAFLAVVAVASANSLKGVDPNTLECDPAGHVHLLLPHFEDCNKFYMCVHGKEVEFSCTGNLIFHFEIQTCNWDWATKCVLRTPKEDNEDGSGDIDVEGSGDDEGSGWLDQVEEVEADETVDELKQTSEEFSVILNCQRSDSAPKQVAYKGDCQRYWKCVNGQAQTVYCSDGLFFNAQTQQCDFEANVHCEDQLEDELKGEFIVYK